MNEQKLAMKLRHAQLRLQAIQDALTTEIPASQPGCEITRLVPVFPSGPDRKTLLATIRELRAQAFRDHDEKDAAIKRAQLAEAELTRCVSDLEHLQPARDASEWGRRLSKVAMMRLKAAEGGLAISKARVQVLEVQVLELQTSRDAYAEMRDQARGNLGRAQAEIERLNQLFDQERRLRQAAENRATGLEAQVRELNAEVGYRRHVGLQEVQLLVPGDDHTTWILRGRQQGLDCLKAQGREEGRQQERVHCISILEGLGLLNVRAVLDPLPAADAEASRGQE